MKAAHESVARGCAGRWGRAARDVAVGVVVLAAALSSMACSKKPDDATIEKQLVGTWSFNPREQLPQDKIDDVAFETPDRVVLAIEPAKPQDNGLGSYAKYEHIPKLEHTHDHWRVHRGQWYVAQGELTLQPEGGVFAEKMRVLVSGPQWLRLDGMPLLPCKKGCSLQHIDRVPEPALRGATPL